MKLWRSGTRSWSRASARTSSSDGSMCSAAASAATAIEHLQRAGDRAVARPQQHEQVVEDVGRLGVDALAGLLARGARDLLGLLLDLLADVGGVVEQGDGVGALGTLGLAGQERALQRGEHLERRGVHVAAVKARALAGVAGRARGLDQRDERVAVAVVAQALDGLR